MNIDNLIAKNTAFSSLHEMADAKGGYRPSFYLNGSAPASEVVAMADAYDRFQKARGDSRTAFRGGDGWDAHKPKLIDAVRAEQGVAKAQAEAAGYPFTRSRGRFIVTCDREGMCEPCTGGVEGWNGTAKHLREIVELVLSKYPDVIEIEIDGGYDGSELFFDGNNWYDPLISEWSLNVWTRAGGFNFKR